MQVCRRGNFPVLSTVVFLCGNCMIGLLWVFYCTVLSRCVLIVLYLWQMWLLLFGYYSLCILAEWLNQLGCLVAQSWFPPTGHCIRLAKDLPWEGWQLGNILQIQFSLCTMLKQMEELGWCLVLRRSQQLWDCIMCCHFFHEEQYYQRSLTSSIILIIIWALVNTRARENYYRYYYLF